jgi:hypothetical protein
MQPRRHEDTKNARRRIFLKGDFSNSAAFAFIRIQSRNSTIRQSNYPITRSSNHQIHGRVRPHRIDRVFADETRAVTAKDSVDVAMRGRGGLVMRVAPHRAGQAPQ